MFAINKKKWQALGTTFHTHTIFMRFSHSLKSQRIWAVMASIFVVALLIAGLTAIALLANWISKIDISAFDPTRMIN